MIKDPINRIKDTVKRSIVVSIEKGLRENHSRLTTPNGSHSRELGEVPMGSLPLVETVVESPLLTSDVVLLEPPVLTSGVVVSVGLKLFACRELLPRLQHPLRYLRLLLVPLSSAVFYLNASYLNYSK